MAGAAAALSVILSSVHLAGALVLCTGRLVVCLGYCFLRIATNITRPVIYSPQPIDNQKSINRVNDESVF